MLYSARQRAAWLRWQAAHNASISATCRHFGIARSTFYRASRRRDEERLDRFLAGTKGTASPRAPRGRPRVYWTAINLELVSRLDLEHPRWGKRQVHAELVAHGFPMSEATVGRMLREIRRRCPVCQGEGIHRSLRHTLERGIRRGQAYW